MTLIRLATASLNRFVPRNLSIHPDLVGAVHEFIHEKHRINIALPLPQHFPTEPNQGELLTFSHYREVNGKKIPSQLWVHAVDVVVAIPEELSVPREILDRPPNAFEIVPKAQQEHLDHLAATYEAVAERAFDLWIRTLRWKCDNSAIGRPEITSYGSGWSTYLVAQPQDQRIWIGPMVFQLKGTKMVTPDIWEEAGTSLKLEVTPPVFIDLIMDAAEHIKLGDLRRAIIDMAIACEVFLRMLLAKSLPPDLQACIVTYVDDANIRPVLEKFVPDILSKAERKELDKIRSKLHALFDIRNEIVHKGRVSELTKERCDAFLEATKELVALRT